MKKAIITIVTLAFITTGSVMAQRGYGYDPRPNPYNNPVNPRHDDAMENFRIDQLDNIVNLSRKQQREIKRIEDRYDGPEFATRNRRSPRDFQQLQWQKNQEIMSVLTPGQRQRLVAYQQAQRPNRGGFYGRRN